MALPKPDLTESEVLAIRALLEARADAGQQRVASLAIMGKICRSFDSPYVAQGSDRDTFVMIGRHQVGVIIGACTGNEALERAKLSDIEKLKLPQQRTRGTRHNVPPA